MILDTNMLTSPVIDAVNQVAMGLYAMLGYQVEEGFKFYAATDKQALICWHTAVVVYFNSVACAAEAEEDAAPPTSLLNAMAASQASGTQPNMLSHHTATRML